MSLLIALRVLFRAAQRAPTLAASPSDRSKCQNPKDVWGSQQMQPLTDGSLAWRLKRLVSLVAYTGDLQPKPGRVLDVSSEGRRTTSPTSDSAVLDPGTVGDQWSE